ncbi:phage tail protein [Streptomyces sp. IBSBF 2806]|uniref:phage tail protein n=1 Tax=Streptomyces sp. IBSBF 2806 TaxID=2903529 RepID=UPI002FDC2DCC
MPESSYLRFLPPVVWQDTPAGSEFSLGDALSVFEKILTGIDDQVPIVHHTNTRVADDESHTHVALTQQIASLHRLFDPWTTPPEFLPWLASWVSLRFPELQGRQLWDEYQRRKATAAISRTHRRRGLRSGLDAILDLYAVGRVRPRLAVDDGSCLFSLRLGSDLPASVSALPTFRPLFDETQKPPRVVREGLMRPWCVARGPDGSLYVGEHGLPDDMPHRRRVWRLNADAQQDVSGSPPLPRPLVPQQTLGQIVAVAVRPALAGQPETLFILERTGRILSVAAPYTADTATEVTNLASGSSVYTLAMAVDDKGDLLVLDRRQMPNEPAAPRVFVVRPSPVAATSEEELDPAIVREPLSLFIDRDGALLVGDGGDQQAPPQAGTASANLVRVVRGGPAWTLTPLLPPDNPLVAPTAVARASDDALYVLDAGLRPFWPSATNEPFILAQALPACVHRVTMPQNAAEAHIVRITEPGQFVNPTGMTAAGGRMVICDPGQIETDGIGMDGHRSRINAFDINVVIHFSAGELLAALPDPVEQQRALSQALGTINSIVEQHKPAHCRCWAVTMTPTPQ